MRAGRSSFFLPSVLDFGLFIWLTDHELKLRHSLDIVPLIADTFNWKFGSRHWLYSFSYFFCAFPCNCVLLCSIFCQIRCRFVDYPWYLESFRSLEEVSLSVSSWSPSNTFFSHLPRYQSLLFLFRIDEVRWRLPVILQFYNCGRLVNVTSWEIPWFQFWSRDSWLVFS
jgi:hypothetical protein